MIQIFKSTTAKSPIQLLQLIVYSEFHCRCKLYNMLKCQADVGPKLVDGFWLLCTLVVVQLVDLLYAYSFFHSTM